MPKTTNWMPTHVQIIYAIQTDFVDLGIEPGCAGRASLIPSYYCIYPVTDEIERQVSVDMYREFQPPPRSPYSFTKLKDSLEARTHTHRNSASHISTCQCKCGYIARQYIDTDISVQHGRMGMGRGNGGGRVRERRPEIGRHSN